MSKKAKKCKKTPISIEQNNSFTPRSTISRISFHYQKPTFSLKSYPKKPRNPHFYSEYILSLILALIKITISAMTAAHQSCSLIGLQRFFALLATLPHCLQRYLGSLTSFEYILTSRCGAPRFTRQQRCLLCPECGKSNFAITSPF